MKFATHRAADTGAQAGRECDRIVTELRKPATYPDATESVEIVETHFSWVFLTEKFAYKFKKPARQEFLDFSTLKKRRLNCHEEVRLNRRLARNIYLGVVPLTVDERGHMRLEGHGQTIEWFVKMRRLPAERMFDVMIDHGTASAKHVEEIARLMGAFFQTNRAESDTDDENYRLRLAQSIRADCRAIMDLDHGFPVQAIASLLQSLLRQLDKRPLIFDDRVTQGRIVEGHGDLRPAHVCMVEPQPVIYDCLEFNRSLRVLDSADELSYLSLECERIGARFVDRPLFETYSKISGDQPPSLLIRFYKTYRACLRARLALWHLSEPGVGGPSRWLARAQEYLSLAEKYCPHS